MNAAFDYSRLIISCMTTLQAFVLLSQPAERSTRSQEACQGRLPFDNTDIASAPHSTSVDLPCHTKIANPLTQQDLSSSQYAFRSSRHLLVDDQIPVRTLEEDRATTNIDLTSTAPIIESSYASSSKVKGTPTQDVVSVEDAAHQQAMQHGAGALGSSRELHRQPGQRFDKSAADRESAQNASTARQTSPEQSEITPGNAQTPHHTRPLCKPMQLPQSCNIGGNNNACQLILS